MIISATGGKKDFAPCPEFSGRAVCVDVSPLKEYETQYGVKQKFKFVFEIDLPDDSRDPVQPWVVMTKPMVPSLHEKAALTKFLKDWFGRKLNDHENKSLDLESLLGRPASIVIGHEQSEDGSKIMGTWICTPGKWRVEYVKWEYCHFQEGYCVITPDGLEPIHLRAGDIFVVEPGMKGTWEVVETVRKYFVFA